MRTAELENLGALGRQVSDATILMHEAIARKAGLTGVDHKYLSIILQQGPLTAGELAGLTGLTSGAITGVIDRLQKKKLVKREFDKTDRRKILVVPNTEKAGKLFQNSHLDLKKQVEKLIGSFSEKEIKAIVQYLTASVDIMKGITNRLNDK